MRRFTVACLATFVLTGAVPAQQDYLTQYLPPLEAYGGDRNDAELHYARASKLVVFAPDAADAEFLWATN